MTSLVWYGILGYNIKRYHKVLENDSVTPLYDPILLVVCIKIKWKLT